MEIWYWLLMIKICRGLQFIGLSFLADWLATWTGLKARLIAFVEESGL